MRPDVAFGPEPAGTLRVMRTIVVGPVPIELEALIARRRALGLDRYDEVWEGEYHMSPAAHSGHGELDQQLAVLLSTPARRAGLVGLGPCNIGVANDYRVPDRSLHRASPGATFVATAALVVEIVSPGDESWAKLDFYAARGVDEVLLIDPSTRTITWLTLSPGGHGYDETDHSAVLDIAAAELAAQIAWPAV